MEYSPEVRDDLFRIVFYNAGLFDMMMITGRLFQSARQLNINGCCG